MTAITWSLFAKSVLRPNPNEFLFNRNCFSQEMNTCSPNSIIVYDLQSGTLFKKWKPESNSVSIAISTQTGCVLNGVQTGDVLVWDLSTGTKKSVLLRQKLKFY